MPALRIALALVLLASCKPRITQKECDALLDRYAELLVTENAPAATTPPEVFAEAKAQVKEAAQANAVVKSCDEVRRPAFICAISASTTDEFERCLE